jgi:hypothetical protein
VKKLEIKTKEDVTTQLIELERALSDPTVYFKKDYRYYLLTA